MRIIKRPTPQTAQMPDTAPQAVQLKESKPVQPNAPQKAKQAVYDSTGQVNYTADFRDAFNFLKQHNPPPIDAAYYAGRTRGELITLAVAYDLVSQENEDICTIYGAEMEQAYWKQVKADRDEFLKQHHATNDPFLERIIDEVIIWLQIDYMHQLAKCLSANKAFDFQREHEQETATAATAAQAAERNE